MESSQRDSGKSALVRKTSRSVSKGALNVGNAARIDYLKERYSAVCGRSYADDYAMVGSGRVIRGIRL
jgi:hypothetical protein